MTPTELFTITAVWSGNGRLCADTAEMSAGSTVSSGVDKLHTANSDPSSTDGVLIVEVKAKTFHRVSRGFSLGDARKSNAKQ